MEGRGDAAVKRATLGVVGALVVAGGVGAWCHSQRGPKLPPPPTAAELKALETERDALQARFRDLVIAAGEKGLARAPRAGVMVGIPTSFTRSIAERVVTGLFGHTTLTLRNLRVHHSGDVKAKILFKKRQVGIFNLDVDIGEVQGLLQPGTPEISFSEQRLGLTLPVKLAEGRGNAKLHFQWDSKGFAANVVCGDADITRDVTGTVVPEDYKISGSFAIKAEGEAVTLVPEFPDLAVRIFTKPTDQAWGVVDDVVKDQRAGCEMALNKIDIKAKLSEILGHGFNVKIPQKIFKPILLPAGLSQSLELQGITLALRIKPTVVVVSEERIWYGADLALESAPRPAAAPKASPAPPPSDPPQPPPR